MAVAGSSGGSAGISRSNLALGLGIGSVVAMLIGMFISGDTDNNGWIWIVQLVLGLAAVAVGVMARAGGRLAGRALTGTVLGALMVILFLLFATGILS